MSEMLGNQYFMARHYISAEKELEPEYLKDSNNKGIRRKLIICYTQTRKFEKALDIFLSLVKEDIIFITSADKILDDCPCPELLDDFNRTHSIEDSYEFNLSHGMLWLYCEESKAIDYLKLALNANPEDEKLRESVEIIEAHIKDLKAN